MNSILVLLTVSAYLAPVGVGEESPRTYERFVRLNPHLDENDPASWGMKALSLSRDENHFFRGSADLFYASCREECADWIKDTRSWVYLHGDVHLGNIGSFQGPGELGSDLHFGLVDFDETFRGPFALDLLRGLTSLHVAAKAAGLTMSESETAELAQRLVEHYERSLTVGLDLTEAASRFNGVLRVMRETRGKNLGKYVDKFINGAPPRFRSVRLKDGQPKDILRAVDEQTRTAVVRALGECYANGFREADRRRLRFADRREFESAVLDVVQWTRVGSSGSQGLRKFLVLLDTPIAGLSSHLILQLKEEPAPAAQRAKLLNGIADTERAALVSSTLRNSHDVPPWLIGHASIQGVGYLVMTRDPWSEELSASDITGKAALFSAAEIMGAAVGSAHRQHSPDHEIIRLLREGRAALGRQLAERSIRVMEVLAGYYGDWKTDQRVENLAARAQAWLDTNGRAPQHE